MSATRLLGLAMFSSWLLAGCSSSKKIEVGGNCILNSDCNSPLLCTDGKCHDACHASVDCPTGQNCVKVSGITVCQLPAEATCSASATSCPASLVCASDQHCRTPCQSAANCAGGQQCVGGVCADPSELSNGQLPGATTDAGTDGQAAATGGAGGGGGSGGASGSSGGAGDAGQLTPENPPVVDGGGDAQASDGSGKDSSLGAGGAVGTDGSSSSGGATGTGGSAGTADGGPGAGGSGDAGVPPGGVWYVDQSSAGGDGRSWATAFATLQAALTNSLLRPGDQIWIAQGTYTPAASGGSRTTYFYLMNGVAIYGGFHGTETALADRDNPVDPSLTVLSADLGANDAVDANGAPTNRSDNSYHVVVGASNAVLDGLTITGGNANGSTTEQQQGGGMYNLLCDGLRLAHMRFVSNLATGSGGGLYNAAGSYTTEEIVDVVFAKNQAGSEGGGVFNSSGNAILTDVTLASNQAAVGGGMTNSSGSPVITHAMFVSNAAAAHGGGLHVAGGNPNLTDATFAGNVVTIVNQNSYGGGVYVTAGAPVLTNVTFVGNVVNDVYGNGTAARGSGIALCGGNSVLTNVTLSGNWTNSAGGGIFRSAGSPKFTNAVIWGNYGGSSVVEISGTGVTFSHSDVHGCGGSSAWTTTCGTDGGGNVDTAATPFAAYRAPSGTWSAVPVYSANRLQTTFTNTLAPWVAGELVGMFVQPDTSKPQRFPIAANTATTLTVWGDAASTAASGTMYSLYDVRLAAGSECIDGGDNAALPADASDLDADGDVTESIPLDLDGRSRVVNGTVDMGAYEHP